MKVLSIDIETYSGTDISNGVYKYSEDPEFEVLLFGYKLDGKDTVVIDCLNDEIPQEMIKLLEDPEVLKSSYNAQFERVCLDRFLGIQSKNWECTMVRSWSLGFEGGLDNVSKALGIDPEEEKKAEGKSLIRWFCKPKRPTKNDPRTRRLPDNEEDLEKWKRFIEYCKQDVEVEAFIRDKLSLHPWPEKERKLYTLDQQINDRGVKVDLPMVENAIRIDEQMKDHYYRRFEETTGIEKPTQNEKLKQWLTKRGKGPVETITKGTEEALKERFHDDKKALTALECRYNTSNSSTAKYKKMMDTAMEDHRIRGTMAFYGAQTGRWAGRLIQVQNLPQNHLEDLDSARRMVKYGDYESLSMLYDDPADILRQCVRPCIVPEKGKKFVVSDFSAIEARVLAWLSGEAWVLDVFRDHGMIYEATAAKMFNLPLDKITKDLRQRGKVATLALGYQGGAGALKAMGAVKMGIEESELNGLKDQWRENNRNIVSFWYDMERAAVETIEKKKPIPVNRFVSTYYKNGSLFIELPSGRALAYPRPETRDSTKFPGTKDIYFGRVRRQQSGKTWKRANTYGGRLVENITQAVARDCLAHSMLRLEEEGYPIVMHVHDEVIVETEEDNDKALEEITQIMGEAIDWAPGLPLRADGYECRYYKKD